MKLLFFLVALIAFTLSTAWIDAEHFERKQFFKNHKSRWLQRFFVIILLLIFDPTAAIVAGVLFWVMFDPVLNLMRGKPVLYFGTESNLDLFFKNNTSFYIAAKGVLTFACLLAIWYAKSSLWEF